MANIFDDELGKQAIHRLKEFGKTNIRYSYVEMYGEEKIREDLIAKMGCECRVKVCYDSHQPMDIMRYCYSGNTSYTVRIPVMPIVIIEKVKKAKKTS